MEQIVKTIEAVKAARESLKQAMSASASAFSPILSDLSKISEIYKVYLDIEKDEAGTPDAHKQLIFCLVYLFCPLKFYGGKMPRGVRQEIVRVTGMNSAFVSKSCTELAILYAKYPDFEKGVDRMLKIIKDRLF